MGAGLVLAIWPSASVAFVLGSPLSTAEGVALGRIASAALVSLGVACWQSRDDVRGRPATGLIRALLLHNGAAVAILAHAVDRAALLGSPDVESLAAAGLIYEHVERMRPIPIDRQALIVLVTAALIPMIPLIGTAILLPEFLAKLGEFLA